MTRRRAHKIWQHPCKQSNDGHTARRLALWSGADGFRARNITGFGDTAQDWRLRVTKWLDAFGA